LEPTLKAANGAIYNVNILQEYLNVFEDAFIRGDEWRNKIMAQRVLCKAAKVTEAFKILGDHSIFEHMDNPKEAVSFLSAKNEDFIFFVQGFRELCEAYKIAIPETENVTSEHFLTTPKEYLDKLFQGAIKGIFLEEGTNRKDFEFVFCGGPKPKDFRPLTWKGNKETAGILFRKFRNPKVNIADMERAVPKHFIYSEENKPLLLAKSRKVNSQSSNRMAKLIETLKI